MIKYLLHKNIDKSRWDECVQKSRNGIIYAFSWYLDRVCPGWEALVENDYQKVMPLTAGKKYGIAYLYPPFFTQQLGLFSQELITDEDMNSFLRAIPEKYKFIEINLNSYNSYTGNDFSVKKNINHELDLGRPYEIIFSGYFENTQRNIVKARKNNLSIRKNIPVAEVIGLFRQNKGKEINVLKERHYSVFKKLSEYALASGHAETRGVFSSGMLCAGVVFMKTDSRSVFLFSGSGEEAKKKRAMFFLIDEYIREYAGQNIIFDFEGSNDKNLARFYRGFGSKECVYLQVRKNKLPQPLKWLKNNSA